MSLGFVIVPSYGTGHLRTRSGRNNKRPRRSVPLHFGMHDGMDCPARRMTPLVSAPPLFRSEYGIGWSEEQVSMDCWRAMEGPWGWTVGGVGSWDEWTYRRIGPAFPHPRLSCNTVRQLGNCGGVNCYLNGLAGTSLTDVITCMCRCRCIQRWQRRGALNARAQRSAGDARSHVSVYYPAAAVPQPMSPAGLDRTPSLQRPRTAPRHDTPHIRLPRYPPV